MKKIISTKGLPDGRYDAPWTVEAIHDRIDFKIAVCYRQDYGDDIQVTPQFFYELADSQVCAIELSYTINNPIPERLESFCEACENYYNLYGFEVDKGGSTPRVYIRVTDLYDMASFIQVLQCMNVSLESLFCAVDASLTTEDAIYSPSGSYIIQLPNIPHYCIKEGTLFISPAAGRYCSKLKKLDIPLGMLFDESSLVEYPKGLKIREWNTHYDGTPEKDEELEDDEPFVVDEKGVAYSEDGKKLKFCRYTFNETRYDVSDGVEEIEEFAFLSCRHYLELSIPHSTKIIGDTIFGNGGVIIIRD